MTSAKQTSLKIGETEGTWETDLLLGKCRWPFDLKKEMNSSRICAPVEGADEEKLRRKESSA
jgi:hypothetical protein